MMNSAERTDEAARLSRWSTLAQFISATMLVAACIVMWQRFVAGPAAPASGPALPSAPEPIDGMHMMGSKEAKVGLVVFSDFQCPACGKVARDVLPTVIRTYVSSGRVLLAFSDLPLEAIHPDALRRASLAECGEKQGRFWEVHDKLFARQSSAQVADKISASLDGAQLQECLGSGATDRVRARGKRALALGIRSTPSFFVGTVDGDRLTVREAFSGYRSADQISTALDRLLRQN